jgi:UDP-glucose 4-epimerase
MKTWLVTGGAGFIGSHLVDALIAGGDRVRVLDDLSSGKRENIHDEALFLRGSITDQALVLRAMRNVDGVFHLAAIASVARCTEEWVSTHEVNQTGTITILDAAHRVGNLPVVYASSAAVYGDLARDALAETDMTDPRSAYGCDKLGSELHARIARRSLGTPTLGLRFFNVYGPRQDGSSPYSGVISVFRQRLQAGEPLVLNGDGRQTRDFVYVADVVEAMIAGMARLPDLPQALNVCTGGSISVRTLAVMLCEMAGVPALLRYGPAKIGDILHSCGDPMLMADSLGLRCRTSLQEGLDRLARAENTGWTQCPRGHDNRGSLGA